MVFSGWIELHSQGNTDTHDLSESVRALVRDSGIQHGVAVVFTPSSTSALTTIEYESGALEDLRRALDQIAPPDVEYQHNLRWGDGNGHSHLRAALIGPSLSIPIVEGQLYMGTWQQILFIDFDTRPRQRRLLVHILGDQD